MSEFFHMGGYAVYVWSAYGVSAVILIALTVWTLASLKRSGAELEAMQALAPRRRRRRSAQGDSGANDAKEAANAQP